MREFVVQVFTAGLLFPVARICLGVKDMYVSLIMNAYSLTAMGRMCSHSYINLKATKLLISDLKGFSKFNILMTHPYQDQFISPTNQLFERVVLGQVYMAPYTWHRPSIYDIGQSCTAPYNCY